MIRTIRRTRSALHRHTLSEILTLLVPTVKAEWKRPFQRTPESSPFDSRTGLDTDRIVEICDLGVESTNIRHAVRYQPSDPEVVRDALSQLPIDYSNFTFVDFGAGKGRVLLIAAGFGFKKIRGVEFSSQLVDIAKGNMAKVDMTKGRSVDIEILQADVLDFPIPTEPLVCYFYNPFQMPIMETLSQRLISSSRSHSRDLYVIYVHPQHRVIFDSKKEWTRCVDRSGFVIYKSPGGMARI